MSNKTFKRAQELAQELNDNPLLCRELGLLLKKETVFELTKFLRDRDIENYSEWVKITIHKKHFA